VNATHLQLPATAVHGSVYLLPKPALRGYVVIKGEFTCATAMSFPLGENATQFHCPATAVHGSVYLLPKPALRGYVVI
jgi:hypothetical protein